MLPLLRLHHVRGERSNVPRDNAALYEAGDLEKLWLICKKAVVFRKMEEWKIEKKTIMAKYIKKCR